MGNTKEARGQRSEVIVEFTMLIPGRFKKVPKTGTLLRKLIAAGRKPLKRQMFQLLHIILNDLPKARNLNIPK